MVSLSTSSLRLQNVARFYPVDDPFCCARHQDPTHSAVESHLRTSSSRNYISPWVGSRASHAFNPLRTSEYNYLVAYGSVRTDWHASRELLCERIYSKRSETFRGEVLGFSRKSYYGPIEDRVVRRHESFVVSAFPSVPPSGEEKTIDDNVVEEKSQLEGSSFENGNGAVLEVEVVENESPQKSPFWILTHWQKRWTIVFLCFFAFFLCNIDRVNMSIAILPMSKEFGWSPSTVGLVQSSFFWGYILTQIVGGVLADKIGGKNVLGFGVVWWSLATLLTPVAANISLPTLLFARACMGIGEGVAMPAMNNMLSRWIPARERSRSLSLVYSGMYLGSVTGLGLSPGLVHSFGWPSCFFSFGSLGALWFALWQSKAVSSPLEDKSLSEKEKNLILAGNPTLRKSDNLLTEIPWRLLLSKAPVWAIIISHFCHNWGTFILLTWMPTYYHDVLGFNLSDAGFFSVLPWLTMAVSANIGGWLADTLIEKGFSITIVRKLMQTIGFLGPAFCLTQLKGVTSPTLAVLCMMVSQGCDAFSQSGLYSNHQDIGPRYAGILLGISNTAGVLAGVLGTLVTGQILQNGSWDEVFGVAVVLYLIGTFVWNIFSTGEKVFD